MSFQATDWARRCPLDSLSAKFTLLMIASYAGTDDSCYPSLSKLAEDTLQSVATVRRRIRELEELGLLVRMARWSSPDGKVTVTQVGDGHRPTECRQTSDELRLLLHVTPDVVRERVASRKPENKGDSEAEESADHAAETEGRVSICEGGEGANLQPRPYHPGETPGVSPGSHPLNSNSNTQGTSPPTPPQAGGGQVVDLELEADIDEFAKNYPAPITNLPRLRTVLSAMTCDERRKVLLAEKGYASFIAECERKGKSRAVKDAHRWVADGSWQGYVTTGERAEAQARMQQVPNDSPEGKALIALHKIAGMQRPFETGGKFLLMGPMAPAVLALADAPAVGDWKFIPADARNQCGAWNAFIADALNGKPRPELINNRNPGGASGFMAPWDWPPRKDGTLCES